MKNYIQHVFTSTFLAGGSHFADYPLKFPERSGLASWRRPRIIFELFLWGYDRLGEKISNKYRPVFSFLKTALSLKHTLLLSTFKNKSSQWKIVDSLISKVAVNFNGLEMISYSRAKGPNSARKMDFFF